MSMVTPREVDRQNNVGYKKNPKPRVSPVSSATTIVDPNLGARKTWSESSQAFVKAERAEAQDQQDLADWMATLNPTQNTNPGGGSGSNYGSYAAVDPKKMAQQKIDGVTQLMQSQTMRSPRQTWTNDTDMRAQVADAAQADQAISGREYDALDEYVAGLQNNFSQDAVAADVGGGVDLQRLLASQGAGDNGLAAEAEFMARQGQQSVDSSNRMSQALGASQDGWNQSMGQSAKEARVRNSESAQARQRGLEMQINALDRQGQKTVDDQNFQMKLADRQNMMAMFSQIMGLAAEGGVAAPEMNIDALMKQMGY
jgi:hypothetical protein